MPGGRGLSGACGAAESGKTSAVRPANLFPPVFSAAVFRPLALCLERGEETDVPGWESGCGSGQYGVVVWMFCDFAAVFGIANCAGSIDDKHSAAQAAIQRAAFDQHSIVFAELRAAMSTEGAYFVDALSPAPAFLTEWQIHADDKDFDVGQLGCLFVEFLCFQVTDRRIQ